MPLTDEPDEQQAPADKSAFARDTPPHVDPQDPEPRLDDEALDTAAEGEGGPAGA